MREFKISEREAIEEAERLYSVFGELSSMVCDEILRMAEYGYDLDQEFELPFYTAVKEQLNKRYGENHER